MEFHETFLKTFYQQTHNIYQKMSKIGVLVSEKNGIIQHTDFIYYYYLQYKIEQPV